MHLFRVKQWLAMGLVLACATQVSASLQPGVQVGDQIKLTNGVGSPGGIFGVDKVGDDSGVLFNTFCVEITEFVNFTSKYAIESIGSMTQYGGKSLTPYTAWLYTSFTENTLNGFSAGSASDVNALQLALWLSIGYTQSDINTYIGASWYNMYYGNGLTGLSSKTWEDDFNADVASGEWEAGSLGDVQIMNLRKVGSDGMTYTDYAQDQLVRVPPPSQLVPEATSLVVWSLLICCGAIVASLRRS